MALGVLAYLVFPWYAIQDSNGLWSIPQVFSNDQAGNGLMQAVVYNRPWLWVGLLALIIAAFGASMTPTKKQGMVLVAAGVLGVAGLMVSGFAIGAKGWSFEVLTSLFGVLGSKQFGMGWGGFLVLVSLLVVTAFGIARQGGFIPDALFTIFNTLVDEEARHMVFFVNWIAHKQIVEGRGALRPFSSLQQYTGAAFRRLDSFMSMGKGKKKSANKKGFTAAGAKAVKVDLTLEAFLEMCIAENAKRMQAYPEELLRPDFLPAIASLAYHTVKFLPKRKASQPIGEELGARG